MRYKTQRILNITDHTKHKALQLLTVGKSLHRRVAFGFETLFPRPRILRQVFSNYPDLKTWQLYWKRVLQLLGWKFKAIQH